MVSYMEPVFHLSYYILNLAKLAYLIITINLRLALDIEVTLRNYTRSFIIMLENGL